MSERKTSEQKLEVRRPDALTAEEDQALLTDMKAASALMLAELIRRYGTKREGGMELKNCTGYAFAPVLSETEIAAYLDHHAVEPSSAWHPVPPAVCLQSGFWLTFSYSAHHIARMFLISTRAANPALAKPDQAMSHGQTMNIELKAKHGTCKAIGELNTLTTGILGDNRANYSSMNGTGPLVCVRKYNPSTYVALIQGPSRKALEKWAAATHGEELSKLSGNKRLFAGAKMATEAFGGYQYPSWSSAAKLSELRRTLGNNVGLHVEITDLKADPSLVSRVRAAGVKLMSYTLTDNDSHIRDLLALKSMGALPDGAILDSTPIKACKMLGLE